MKNSQRLDYAGLAEILSERGLVDPQRLARALQTSQEDGTPFPETLVLEDLLQDWELSRLVCELFALPFLPVDVHPPLKGALEVVDRDFVRTHRLIPVEQHGSLLTVCMPALVPAETLGLLSAQIDLHVVPVVGTVRGNLSWIDDSLPVEAPSSALPAGSAIEEPGWGEVFDAGEAAVQLDLNSDAEPGGAEVILPELPDLPEL